MHLTPNVGLRAGVSENWTPFAHSMPLECRWSQLIQKCCLCHFDQKDLEGMSFDKEMVFEASFFCCGADALMLAIGGNSFSTSSVSNTTSCHGVMAKDVIIIQYLVHLGISVSNSVR